MRILRKESKNNTSGMNRDTLHVTSNRPCASCGGKRRKRRNCEPCRHTGFEIASISGLWKGCSAFLICGGPSLREHRSLNKVLRERGVVSLAVNNVAGYLPARAWCFGDPANKFHTGLFLDPAIITFCPHGKMREKIRLKVGDHFRMTEIEPWHCPNTWGFSRTSDFDAGTFWTSEHAYWGWGGKVREGATPEKDRLFRCLATMLLGIRLLHYLGVARIYTIGTDFKMNSEAPYAFSQSKTAKNSQFRKQNQYISWVFNPENQISIDLEMLNCVPESGLTAIPYVPISDAIQDCRNHVPPEPFDLAHWYSKRLKNEMETLFPDRLSRLQVFEELSRRRSE